MRGSRARTWIITDGSRRRCFLANHGTRVPGGFLAIPGCALLGLAPVSALDGSAQCFTICTSRRARRLNFVRMAPLIYIYCLPPRRALIACHCNHLSRSQPHSLFSNIKRLSRPFIFPRTTEKTVQRPQQLHQKSPYPTTYRNQTS